MLNNSQIASLVENVKKGKKDAFESLYNATWEGVYFLLLKRMGDEYAAKEVLQDTFLKVHRSIGTLKDNMAFVAWVNRIAYNYSMNYLNAQQKRQTEFDMSEDLKVIKDDDEDFVPEAVIMKSENSRIIMEMIDALPRNHKECVMMFYYEEIPAKEIARIMGTTEGNIFKKLHDARRALKNKIEKLNEEGLGIMTGFQAFNFVLKQEASRCVDSEVGKLVWNEISASIVASVPLTATISKTFSGLTVKVVSSVTATAVIIGSIVLTQLNSAKTQYEDKTTVIEESANHNVIPTDEEFITSESTEGNLGQAMPEPVNGNELVVAEGIATEDISTTEEVVTEGIEETGEEEIATEETESEETTEGIIAEQNEGISTEPTEVWEEVRIEETARALQVQTATQPGAPDMEISDKSPEPSAKENSNPASPEIKNYNIKLTYEVNEITELQELASKLAQASGGLFTEKDIPAPELAKYNGEKVGSYVIQINRVESEKTSIHVTSVINVIDTMSPVISITNRRLNYEAGELPTIEKIMDDAVIEVTDNAQENITPIINGYDEMCAQIPNDERPRDYVLNVSALDSSGNKAPRKDIIITIK